MRKDQAKISKKPESWEEVNTDFMCHPSVHSAISKNAYERGKRDGNMEGIVFAIRANVIQGHQIHSLIVHERLSEELEKLKGE